MVAIHPDPVATPGPGKEETPGPGKDAHLISDGPAPTKPGKEDPDALVHNPGEKREDEEQDHDSDEEDEEVEEEDEEEEGGPPTLGMKAWLLLRKVMRPVLREGDGDDIVQRKSVLVIIALLCCVMLVIMPFMWVAGSPTQKALTASRMILWTTCGPGVLFYLGYFKTAPVWLSETCCFACALMVPLMDYTTMLEVERWPFLFVAQAKGVLVHVRPPVLLLYTAITMSWLVVRTVDETWDIGLTAPLDDHWGSGRAGWLRARPDHQAGQGKFWFFLELFAFRTCALCIPCVALIVFSHQIRTKQAALEGSIALSEEIAVSLERFDLQMARSVLNDAAAAAMPKRLERAFAGLLHNLQLYRPYLPCALFPDEAEIVDKVEASGAEVLKVVRSQASDVPARTTTDSDAAPPPPRLTSMSMRGSSVGSRQGSLKSASCAPAVARLKARAAVGQVLQAKAASLVALNGRGFLPHVAKLPADGVGRAIRGFTEAALVAAARCKGSPAFAGDRCAVLFNCASRCVMHRESAARCGLMLTADKHETRTEEPLLRDQTFRGKLRGDMVTAKQREAERFPVSAAVVGGNALYGSVGSELVRRQEAVGSLTAWGWMVERLCGSAGAAVLVDEAVYRDTATRFYMAATNRAAYRKHREGRAAALYHLLGARHEEDVEWMYSISGEDDPYAQFNAAVAMAHAGRGAVAVELLQKCGALPAHPQLPPIPPALIDAADRAAALSVPQYIEFHDFKAQLQSIAAGQLSHST